MKAIAIVGILMIAVFGLEGTALAFEGGTKAFVAMNQTSGGTTQYSPLVLAAPHEFTPSKPVLQLLHRMFEPPVAGERIRQEKPGRSTGTKAVVLFQQGR